MWETNLLCPIIVGRAPALATIDQSLSLAANGNGRAVIISGEAGIGKSRLAIEAKVRAVAAGIQVIQGNCFESDRSFPYAPLIDLLRDLCSKLTPETGVKLIGGASASQLVKVLPEIRDWFPDIAAMPPTDPEQEKHRLFHALAETLSRVAGERPMLLIVEDIHWCDDNSLEFLLAWARRVTNLPALLLLTLRSEESPPNLSHFLATMLRLRLAIEVELERLNATDVETMLRAMLGQGEPIQAEFSRRLYGLSEGNPFFTEEIVNALWAAGNISLAGRESNPSLTTAVRLPRTVRDAVLRRSQRLSPDTHHLLSLAAVAGRRFDLRLLEVLTGYDEAKMLRLIKELMDSQLVLEESADQFEFRHALTQHVIYTDLLARERQAMHRTIAYQLEESFKDASESHLTELARHFYEAGEWKKALEYAGRSGGRALALYAPRAAVEHLTNALTAATRLGMPAPRWLLQSRGQAYEMLGEFLLAQADFERALSLAESGQAPVEEWQALVHLGMLWAGRDYQKTGDYYQRAFSLAEAIGDQTLMARSLNRMGNWYVNHEEPIVAQQRHLAALVILEENNDEPGIAETCDFLGMAFFLGADLIQSTRFSQRAIALYRDADQRTGLSSSLATLGICSLAYQCSGLTPAWSLSEAEALCRESLKVAHASGQRSTESFSYFCLGCVLGPEGAWGAALEMMESSLAIAEEIGHRQWMCAALTGLGDIHRDILDADSACRFGEQALEIARQIGSLHWHHCASAQLASSYVAQGDLTRAAATLLEAGKIRTPAISLGEHWLARSRIELLLAQAHYQTALAELDELIAHTPGATRLYHSPLLALLRGRALAATGQTDEAELCWKTGMRAARDLSAWVLVWQLYGELAKLYYQSRRRTELLPVLDETKALIGRLAGGVVEGPMRDAFVNRALVALPQAAASLTKLQAAKQQHNGLTSRELEVARCIALGKSNRVIGQELVVSERTIESHVSNILGKLGFTTRTQIAAWVVEQGLARSHQ